MPLSSIHIIDLFKFIFSILIITIHTNPFKDINIELNFWLTQFIARMGVPFFFICTGYFLCKDKDLKKVYISGTKSIKKLLKIYLIWSFIYFPITLINILNSNSIIKDILNYIRNFIFVGSYYHLWYLLGAIIALILFLFCLRLNFSYKKIICLAFLLHLFSIYQIELYPLIENYRNNYLIELYQLLFVTSRNGIFFGFFYISLGALISQWNIQINRNWLKISFICFLLLWIVEVYLVKIYVGLLTYDVYVFLIPVMIFFFCLIITSKIQFSRDLIKLRQNSMIIYLLHPLLIMLVDNSVKILLPYNIMLNNFFIKYLIVTILSILMSNLIIKIKKYINGTFKYNIVKIN